MSGRGRPQNRRGAPMGGYNDFRGFRTNDFKGPRANDFNGPRTNDFNGPRTNDFKGPRTNDFRGPRTNDFRGPRTNDFKGPGANDSRPQFRETEENEEEELATKAIQIQTKRFYIDVKKNKKGKFIKIAEVSQVGRKKRLLLSMSTAAIFRDHLSKFTDHYSTLGPKNENSIIDENEILKSEVINRDERRYYYLDLKENSRGRYLRVCMTMPLSKQRFHIAIPAQGMIEIRDALTELLKIYGTEDDEDHREDGLPGARTMRVENKLFYFDVGENNKGIFMRISEVRSNYRTSITLPDRCWSRFKEILSEFTPKISDDQDVKRDNNWKDDIVRQDRVRMVKVEKVSYHSDCSSSDLEKGSAVVNGVHESSSEALAVGDL